MAMEGRLKYLLPHCIRTKEGLRKERS